MVQFCLGYVMKQQYKSQSLVLYNTNDTLNHLVSPHTKRRSDQGPCCNHRERIPHQELLTNTTKLQLYYPSSTHARAWLVTRTICTTRSHHETMDLNTSSAVSGSKCASTCITELTGFTCTGLLSSCTPCFQYLLSKLKIHTSIAEGHEIS